MKTFKLVDVNGEMGDVVFETGLSRKTAKDSIAHYEERYQVTPEIVEETPADKLKTLAPDLLEALRNAKDTIIDMGAFTSDKNAIENVPALKAIIALLKKAEKLEDASN